MNYLRSSRVEKRGVPAALAVSVAFGLGTLAIPPAQAQTVGAGQFSLFGDVYISGTSLIFGLDNNIPPTSQTAAIVLPETGLFAGLSFPQTVQIKNVTSPTAANGNVSIPQWIILPNGIDLDLANIAPNTGVAMCTAANNVPGSGFCVIAPGSHILLSEGANDLNGNPTVFMSITVSGLAYFASSPSAKTPWVGVLSQVIPNTTVTGLVSTFDSQGYFNTAFSATFRTSASPPQATQAIIDTVNALNSQGVLNGGRTTRW